ncbi:MAG TPA: Ldh family oxidoreductase, partial [Micavibrio sp.]|nr:Ldh family oxidoreductase [Micavibrio sp.]
MTEYLTFPARTLRDFAATIMQSGGFTADEAAITADSLILSNLLGHDSHGVMRVTEYMSFLKNGELFSGKQLETLKETENSLWVNGHYGLGQVQMSRFLDQLVAKAKTQAVVCGAMQDCAHIGRLGEWSERLGAKGFAAIVCANDNGTLQFVTPPGGKQGRTSTNPMALAIPLPDNDVFSLDISTSAVAVGKIKLAYQSGERVAEGLLQDAEGSPTTDPSVMFTEPKGTLQSFGGAQSYKGFGLSMFVDLLVAGLSGGFAPP